jgi:ABC-type nitrate/sulfonate/bicarbonate transport system substrate-binding protein
MEKFMRRLAILLAGCLSASAGSQAWAADHVTVATDWSPHGMVSGLSTTADRESQADANQN